MFRVTAADAGRSRDGVHDGQRLVEEARAAGAGLLCGRGRDGRDVEATLLRDVRRNLRSCAREVFARIVVVEPYAHEMTEERMHVVDPR